MRIANVGGRAAIVGPDSTICDIAERSSGRFSADPRALLEDWDALRDWADRVDPADGEPLDPELLGVPVPDPRQIFAVGMNYVDHAEEIGVPRPEAPTVFTKYQTSLAGPFEPIRLVAGSCDWEVEVVAVVSRYAYQVSAVDGWEFVGALTVGQDISERTMQTAGATPQFSLAKSFPTFGPLGPWLVSTDELPDRDALELGCSINGEVVQRGSTKDLVFAIPELVARLSQTLPLLPGDLIFTGTPAGVGAARDPQRFLTPGDVVESWVSGIGTMRNRCVGDPNTTAGSTPERVSA